MKEHKITDILIIDAIDKAIAYYGLEGTEEAIRRVYTLMPDLQKKLIDELKRRINNG